MKDLGNQESRWKMCVEINEEYSTNQHFLSLLQTRVYPFHMERNYTRRQYRHSELPIICF